MTVYNISVNGVTKGPYTRLQLTSMWASGQITADALYWTDGMADWEAIEKLGMDSNLRVDTARPPRLPPSKNLKQSNEAGSETPLSHPVAELGGRVLGTSILGIILYLFARYILGPLFLG